MYKVYESTFSPELGRLLKECDNEIEAMEWVFYYKKRGKSCFYIKQN